MRPDAGTRRTFVGRDAELALLHAAWAAANKGSARFVGLAGDPGIGKAALLEQFLFHVDARVLRAAGKDGFVPADGVVLREVVAQLPWRRADRSGRRGVAGSPGLIARKLLEDLRGAGPLVVIVERAQWVDVPSLQALAFVAQRLQQEPIMMIVSYRPARPGADTPAFGGTWSLYQAWLGMFSGARGLLLTLGGLSVNEVVRFAARSGSAGLPLERAARLWEATGGHPVFLRNVLRTALASVVSGHGPLEIPREIAPSIAAALADCSRDTREVMEAAAVLGPRFSAAQLRFVAGTESVAGPIEEALDAGLLVDVTGDLRELAFAENLTRHIVYHTIGRGRRAELHRRCAVRTSGPDSLVHRISAVEGTVDEALAADLTVAARARLAAGDAATAGFYMRSALDCSAVGSARLPRLFTAVEAMLVAGTLGAVREYEGEIQQAPAGPWRDYVRGYVQLLSANVAEAKKLFEAALAALSEERTDLAGAPSDLRARIATLLAVIGLVLLSYPDMIEYGAIAVAADSPDPAVAGFAWFAKTVGLALSGRGSEAVALLAGAGEPGDRAGMERLVARGMIHLWRDDLDGAAHDLHEAARRATEGHALRVSQGVGFLGEVEYRRGRLAEATEFTGLAVGHAEFQGRIWDLPILHALAAYPCAATGDWANAIHHVEASAAAAAVMATPSAWAYAAGARAALAQARGDDAEMLLAAQDLEAHYDAREPGTNLFGALRAEALCRLGRVEQAEVALSRFRAVTEPSGRRSAAMAVARVAAQIASRRGEHNRALAECATAAGIAVEIGLPLEEARILLVRAQCLHTAHREDAAERTLRAARTRCVALGADAYRDLTDRLADRLCIVVATTPPLERLTPVERTVARLAVEGKRNAEIADVLGGRSVKTVESHMSSILKKLGIRDRIELAGCFPPAP